MLEDRNAGPGAAMGRTPRKLSTHQQAVLIQVLLAFPDERVGVCYLSSAGDAQGYAEDFLIIFKAISWSPDDMGAVDVIPMVASGLAVLVKGDEAPASSEALRDALRIYRIEAEILKGRAEICGTRNFVLAVS
jgi:hypothetical protein